MAPWLENTRNELDNNYRLEVIRVADELIELIDAEPEENPEVLVKEYVCDHDRVTDPRLVLECIAASPSANRKDSRMARVVKDLAYEAFLTDVQEAIVDQRKATK